MTQSDRQEPLRRSAEDPEAFVAFYHASYRRILGYIARRVLDPELALDLAAETFAQAFASRRRFRGSTAEEAHAWVLRIAQTQVSRYFKRGEVDRRAMERLGLARSQPTAELCREVEEFAQLDEIRGALRSNLARLSAGSQQALWLRIVEGCSYDEVAERLQVTVPTARARVARALRNLRGQLDNEATSAALEG